jgi:hypothetical protein
LITDGWKEENWEKGNIVSMQCTSDGADGGVKGGIQERRQKEEEGNILTSIPISNPPPRIYTFLASSPS